jgi:ParB-like chromosome segregation protein Spo0J
MAKTGSFLKNVSAIVANNADRLKGIKLSDIERVSVNLLKHNPLNQQYFFTESPQYFDKLREDIRERGIIVPLIAKEDGTLLAGHNRLQLAKELGYDTVPVQYALEDLSGDEEKGFLIKDNLLRRQLSNEQRINLYKTLYPEFEERFLNPDALPQAGRKNTHDKRLSLEQIARETGQSVSAVKLQVKRKRDSLAQRATADKAKKRNRYNVTISLSEEQQHPQTSSNLVVSVQQIIRNWKKASAKEQKEAKKLLESFLKSI